MLEAELKPKLS